MPEHKYTSGSVVVTETDGYLYIQVTGNLRPDVSVIGCAARQVMYALISMPDRRLAKKLGWMIWSEGSSPSPEVMGKLCQAVSNSDGNFSDLAKKIADEFDLIKSIQDEPLTIFDFAYAGQKLIEYLGKFPDQEELAKWLSIDKRGMAQNVWRILAVNHYGGPELDYLRRVCLPKNDPQYLDWQYRLSNKFYNGIRQASGMMIMRMDLEWVDKERMRCKMLGKPECDWPEYGNKAEFIEWFTT